MRDCDRSIYNTVRFSWRSLFYFANCLHRGCERVLGGIGSNWVHNPAGAMDLVGGQAEPPSSVASLWAWLRDPLIPAGENSLATQLRTQLGVPDSQTFASVNELDRGAFFAQSPAGRLRAMGDAGPAPAWSRWHDAVVRIEPGFHALGAARAERYAPTVVASPGRPTKPARSHHVEKSAQSER
jgi:hypothetical protein